jgi:NO-binding membrane sensor protein with MHYT domain/two-component sensor histidine kinase
MLESIGLTFGPAPPGSLPGDYNLGLVALSVVVAAMASYTALDMASRVTQSRGRDARLWLVGGAFAMGAGIWSMHFVGMLAFSLPIRMAYDFPITMASMVIAIVISGFALSLVSRKTLATSTLLLGGLFMGIGICAMHYSGMAAMRMDPPIRYDPWLFFASVLIAVGASIVALWLAFTLRTRMTSRAQVAKILAAVVMGLAISGMHYTGMAAANFETGSVCRAVGPAVLADTTLGFTIGAVILVILTVTLVASMFDARRARQLAEMLGLLEQANKDLEVQKRELERSNKELEQFAYVASHDLQAPLRVVTNFVQLLQQKYQGTLDADTDAYIGHIVDATRSMRQLIQALLELGRIGKKTLEFRKVTLQQLLDEARGRLQAIIQEREAVIASDSSLPELVVDPVLTVQLLQNLLSNAIKFQPRQRPEVQINARRGKGEWVVSVADHGIGIDPKHFERIFQIFQRLHTTEQFEGSGVGLAICEKIVHLHGGRIWVESETGKGSTFYFSIPDSPPIARAA